MPKHAFWINFALLITLSAAAAADAEMSAQVIETDPASAALQSLAAPAIFNDADYGCGPLLEPGRTFYVALDGDDRADGLSRASAWRHIHRALPELTAGDTLLMDEGEYVEPQLEINMRTAQCGAPGRPIRIMAVPGRCVIVSGAPKLADFQRAPKWRYLWMADCPYPAFSTAWETLTDIELQRVPNADTADELPGTYWHDTARNRLYVHFADSREATLNLGVRVMPATAAAGAAEFRHAYVEMAGTLSRPRDARNGLRIHGDYIHLKGIWFKHHVESVVVSANASFQTGAPWPNLNRPLGGRHNTIEDCVFSANENAGILLTIGAERCLVRNNRFTGGGFRSALFTQNANDNLIRNNLVHVRTSSERTRAWWSGCVFANYGGRHPAQRNHLVENIVLGAGKIEWKPRSPGAIVQGNVFYGIYCTGTRGLTPTNRVILRNNLIGGAIAWEQGGWDAAGTGGVDGDWVAADRAFINNVQGFGNDAGVQTARFADTAWLDYRLQSDSPLIGAGVGGMNRGPVPLQSTRVFYVGTNGDDQAAGTSERLAFKTFARAGAALRPGDALYVLPGDYPEQLILVAGGTMAQPVTVRAYQRGPVTLPGAVIAAAHVELAGFAVQGAGVTVTAPHVAVRECLVLDAVDAGVLAAQAPAFRLYRSTITGCRRGLVIENGSTNATVRESVIAGNQLAQVTVADDSRAGYIAGQNCYDGPGVDRKAVAAEFGSIVGAPLFADPNNGDYRLRWDSPVACLTYDGRMPGALGGAPRTPVIADVRVAGVWSNAALVHWNTPFDDTTCRIEFRSANAAEWTTVSAPGQGTVHGAGLAGLRPATAYECRVTATGRRGGEGESEIFAFATPAPDAAIQPRTFYVAPDGDDAAYGQSPDKAWRTLRKACFMAGPGDTVLVAPGVYRHAIIPLLGGVPEQRLTFRRHGAGAVVMDGEYFVAPMVVIAGRDYVTVDGFTFTRAPFDDRSGLIGLYGSQGAEILNCRMDAMPRDVGILVSISNGSDVRLEGNLFWGGAYHMRCDDVCRNILVRNNTFARCNIYHTVITAGADGVRFVNNIFYLPCSPKKNNARYYQRGDVKNFSSDYNLFYSPHPHQTTIGLFQTGERINTLLARDLREWQAATGHDSHSIMADPMFVLAPIGHTETNGNFHLQPGSPALNAGESGANIGAFGLYDPKVVEMIQKL